jgi:hypothetical protein
MDCAEIRKEIGSSADNFSVEAIFCEVITVKGI